MKLRMVQEDYCKLRGYDPKTGVPIRKILEELMLTELADKLDSLLAANE